jgi:predicted RNA-binding Zn-ribbon protein involved in translation (DUF1610 family)
MRIQRKNRIDHKDNAAHMKASRDIVKVDLAEEFRICPQCGYELGFHSSFLQAEEGYRIIFICPECGARYDVGWKK